MSAHGRGTVRQTPMAEAARSARAGESAGLSAAIAPAQAPTIMPALFTSEQAAAYMGISEAKFHELRDEPWMAASISLSVRMVRWARADLDAAIAAMPRQARRSAEPAQLLRTRIERAKRTGDLQ